MLAAGHARLATTHAGLLSRASTSAAAAAPLKAQVLLLAQLPKVEEQARAVLAELRGGSSEGEGEAVPETAAKGMAEVGALLERYVAAQRDVVAQLQA